MYQMMLGSEYEEDFEHIELKYINNKGNEKSPEILGKIDSKNRNKLESIQINLGVQYGLGQGVPRNPVLAHMWFAIAAAQGKKMAARNRDRTAKRMTPAQISEAEKKAREWLRKHKKK